MGNGAFFLQNGGFTVLLHHPEDLIKRTNHTHSHQGSGGGSNGTKQLGSKADGFSPVEAGGSGSYQIQSNKDGSEDLTMRSHAYRMVLVGMNPNAVAEPEKQQSGYNNYFIGTDTAKHASNCRIFGAVTYKNVYPNIDMRYFTDEGTLKYEFVIHPGGDPSRIAMQYEGASKLTVSKGELVVKTTVGEVREMPPYTYQMDGKGRTEIASKYKLNGNIVRFALDDYDRNATLVIDPSLIFSTFTGSRSDNWGYTATYGGDGSLYSGGIVFGNGFPVSTGAFQSSSSGGGFDIGIMKFDPLGSQRMYATYIGGGGQDQPHSLIVDPQGDLIIAGRTNSSDFPAVKTYGPGGGFDIIIFKLNPFGTARLGAVRIGGTGTDGLNTEDSHSGSARGLLNFYGDDARSEVITDRNGNIYVAASTQSTNFFTTANAPYKTLGGGQDAVLIKADPGLTDVLLSTYLGGSDLDAAFVLGVRPQDGDIWVCGSTLSANFPGNAAGTMGATHNGNVDGFIAVFSSDGSVHKRTTFIGTPSRDAILGFSFDRDGDPYVMGITYGQWNKVNAVYGTDGAKQFVGKIRPDLSGWQYTTTFGTAVATPNISPVAFLVDRCENVYVSGWGGTGLGQFAMAGTSGMDITSDAIKSTTDNNDFYFIVIKRDASELLYGSFFGQNGNFSEHVDGGTSRYDQNGVIYQAMCANCYGLAGNRPGSGAARPRFPVTPGAWCCSNGYSGAHNTGSGSECNLGALKIHFNFAGVGAGVQSLINGVVDTAGCVPLTVTLRDTIRNAVSYEWDFGDGSAPQATTSPEMQHTYTQVGTYRVRLIAIDPASCNERDTSYINIRVRTDQAFMDFDAIKMDPCESLTYRFENYSIAPAGKPFSDTSFLWDFGDGTTLVAGGQNVVHSYAAPGTYIIRLTLKDTVYCNEGDVLTKEYNLAPLVRARFELPNGCAPYEAQIENTSIAGRTYLWDFGDGTTSTEKTPQKIFANAGTYRVTLTVTDPNTCNVVDATSRDVVVQDKPTAAFTHSPTVPVENTPVVFSNNSSADAISFVWDFGDNSEKLMTSSRLPVDYQYNSTGQFNACLAAFNQSGCADTVCAPVEAIVVPRVDVPNAFTPLGPAPNNTVFVRGFAIERMRLMIFNRLGQKVFESNSMKLGWDGRFNGVLQPMDVYAYVLEVEFTDKTRTTKKGDITLIR